jgi:hypothetical protein
MLRASPALAGAQQVLLRLFQLEMNFNGALLTFNIFTQATFLPIS